MERKDIIEFWVSEAEEAKEVAQQMAEIDTLVLNNIRTFIEKLNKSGIHILKAYVFGSYAKDGLTNGVISISRLFLHK